MTEGFERRARLFPLAIAAGLVALLLTLPFLGEADFLGDDEALDARVVREMVSSGDWLFPELDGEVLPPKPPLFYWGAALVAKVQGRVDEWSMRLPSVLAGAATVAITVAAGAAFVGSGPAFLGGLMLATTRILHDQSRIGRCDMTMAVLVVAILFLYGRDPEGPSRRRRAVVYVLLGLATLAKAAVAPGLVFCVVVADALVERRPLALGRWIDRSVLAFLVIGGSWFAAAAAHWGMRFVEQQIFAENLRHFVTGPASGPGGTRSIFHEAIYFGSLFRENLPWGLLLVPAIVGYARRPPGLRTRGERFLIVWIAAGLVFFTLAARKSPYYLLPLAPPVALLAARWVLDAIPAALGGSLLRDLRARALVLGAGVSAGILLLLGTARGLADWPTLSATREALLAHPFFFADCALVLGAFAARALVGVVERDGGAPLLAAWLAVAATFLLIDASEGPLARIDSMRPFAEAVTRQTEPGDRLFFWRMPIPAIALYSKRRISTLRDPGAAPAPPFYVIVPESDDAKLPEGWLARSTTVATGEGRVFTRKRMTIRLLRIERSPGSPWTFACAAGGG